MKESFFASFRGEVDLGQRCTFEFRKVEIQADYNSRPLPRIFGLGSPRLFCSRNLFDAVEAAFGL